jgi:hypothetical protein
VPAERILWNGEAVGDQLLGLRNLLTRALDDAAGSLRQAQNRLRRQEVSQTLSRGLDAKMRHLERSQERVRVLWHNVQRAQETLNRVERELIALAGGLAKGEDSASPFLPAGGVSRGSSIIPPVIPWIPSVIPGLWILIRGRRFLLRLIPQQYICIRRPPLIATFSHAPDFPVVQPVFGFDALLKGKAVIGAATAGAAWAAPQSVTPPWLAEMLAKPTKP